MGWVKGIGVKRGGGMQVGIRNRMRVRARVGY